MFLILWREFDSVYSAYLDCLSFLSAYRKPYFRKLLNAKNCLKNNSVIKNDSFFYIQCELIKLTLLIYLQVSDHSNVISVAPRSLKRATCSATSNCTLGRNPLNALFAAMPVEDEMHSLATFALTHVRTTQAWFIYRIMVYHESNRALFHLVRSVLSNCRETLQMQLLWP